MLGGRGSKRALIQLVIVSVIAVVIGTWIVLAMDWFPEDAATAGKDVDVLYDVALIFSVPIFVLTMAVAGYCIYRFRARPGDTGDGANIHGNTKLEVIWVTVPFLIVTGLAIYAWILLDDIEAKKPNEMPVKVVGQQFAWSFEYPEQKVKSSTLMLPKGRPVHFAIETRDVIHSFWVPEFRLKTDTVPGITTRLRLTPNKTGEWQVVCTELCGIGHSTMRQEVKVVEPAQFTAWVDKQKKAGTTASAGGQGGAAQAGKDIYTATGCGGCHTLADAGTQATTGPALDDLAKVAAKRKPGTSAEEYIRESIVKPNAFLTKGFPKGVMPEDYEQQLEGQQVDQLVKYLLDVSGGKSK